MAILRSVFRLLALVFVCLPAVLVLRFVGLVLWVFGFFVALTLAGIGGLRGLVAISLQRILAWVDHLSSVPHPEAEKMLLPSPDNENVFTWQDEVEVVSHINGLIGEIGQDEDKESIMEKLNAVVFLLDVLRSHGAADFEDLKESTTLKLKEAAPHIEFELCKISDLLD